MQQPSVAVSIIVPVYNTERYLKQCLDSLVNQTLENIEIIVINDGSPDNSQEIIDTYVDMFPNKIKAYQKENGGLGDARNFGIKNATGEYLGFVDSDDWAKPNTFDLLYKFAKKNNNDVVIFDKYTYFEENGGVAISFGYNAKQPFCHQSVLLNSIQPAHACNKIYKKELFNGFEFIPMWYEDVGLIPAVLSYAKSIGYLRKPLYYYRQSSDSITHNDKSAKNLDIIKAWNSAISLANTVYKTEIAYAVYASVIEFLKFRPRYSSSFIEYIQDNRDLFSNNEYIENGIIDKSLQNLFDIQLIPKKIHYFWFGNGEKSKVFYKCKRSWEKFAPGYDIIEWTEDNCDISENDYVKQAYTAKKWAFVSDYFRLKVLYEQGGFYVDTDTEFNDCIDWLRTYPAVFPYETKTEINACVFACCPRNKLILAILETYRNDSFISSHGILNTKNHIVARTTEALKQKYKIDLDGQTQVLFDGTILFSPNVLVVNVFDGKNIAEHHYEASWCEGTENAYSYKNHILKSYFDIPDVMTASRWKKVIYFLLFDKVTLKNKLYEKISRMPKVYSLLKRIRKCFRK